MAITFAGKELGGVLDSRGQGETKFLSVLRTKAYREKNGDVWAWRANLSLNPCSVCYLDYANIGHVTNFIRFNHPMNGANRSPQRTD